MESTYNKVSPVVENTLEMVTPMMDSVKSKVEEQVLPHIPAKITETVQNYQEVAVDKVIAAVEKVDTDNAKTMSSLVQMVHSTANSLRHGAARSAGTPLAKMIDESSLTGALGEATGLTGLMERLGLVGSVTETKAEETSDASTDVKEDTTVNTSDDAITEQTKEPTLAETSDAVVIEATKEATSEALITDIKEAAPAETSEAADTEAEVVIPAETSDAAVTVKTVEITEENASEAAV